MDSAISVSGLTKRFGGTRALDGFDLEVKEGRVHGLLGPAGSGKSTAIRVLAGLLRADSGTATVLGRDAWHESVAVHRRVAYVPGDVALWPHLTGGDAIALLGRLRGGTDPERRSGLVERFELDPTLLSDTYSRGDRQKVALIAAFAADTDLLILDEPITGLDSPTASVLRQCIAEHAARGGTVLLSSHDLAEVRNQCNSVTVLDGGKHVQSGTVHELSHFMRTTVTATTHIRPSPIGHAPGVHNLRRTDDPNTVVFDVDADQLDPVMTTLTGFGIVSIAAHPPTLEHLLLHRHRTEPPTPALAAGATR